MHKTSVIAAGACPELDSGSRNPLRVCVRLRITVGKSTAFCGGLRVKPAMTGVLGRALNSWQLVQ